MTSGSQAARSIPRCPVRFFWRSMLRMNRHHPRLRFLLRLFAGEAHFPHAIEPGADRTIGQPRRAEPGLVLVTEGQHDPRRCRAVPRASPEVHRQLFDLGIPPSLQNRPELAQGTARKPQETACRQYVETGIDQHQWRHGFSHLMDERIEHWIVAPPDQRRKHFEIARTRPLPPAFPARYPALRDPEGSRDIGLVESCRNAVAP